MSVTDKAQAASEQVRKRAPWLDHFIRAYQRFTADGGNNLAAAVTYFAFLSIFPLLAIAFAVLGYVVTVYPDAQQQVQSALQENLPGLVGEGGAIQLENIQGAARTAGVVGLLGLLYAGTGWVDALREAVRTVWHQNIQAGNVVVKKVKDVLILAGLGAVMLVSLAVSGLTTTITTQLLELVGLAESGVARLLLAVLGPALALVVDTVFFIYLFTGLPKVKSPVKRVLKGAILAAVGFEVLKLFGAQLISGTTGNPVYGSFAVVVGLLVWISYVSRLIVFASAYVVTAPYDTDVEPSGTASPQAAKAAGVPEEYADESPASKDDPPVLQDDGAPTPLRNAIQGQTPPQDAAEGRGSLDDPQRRERKRDAAPGLAPGGARAGSGGADGAGQG
ncbi:MAG: YihY/virulence factor BrkB family protein, partial [Actinomycetota bacterium]|nr:YihY/virulence factor BrkB family protein [Actinomycetota bacterium]